MDGDALMTESIKRAKCRQKPFIPSEEDREFVKILSTMGITIDIAIKLVKNVDGGRGIPLDTFFKHFREEWQTGGMVANAKVANALYNSAINGDVTAQIFWCKTKLGWRTTEQVELGTPGQFDNDSRTIAQRTAVVFERAQRLGIVIDQGVAQTGGDEPAGLH